MTQKRIDIIQEFVDLYPHEQTVAFFEFRVGGTRAVDEPESLLSALLARLRR